MQTAELGCRMTLSLGVGLAPAYSSEAARAAALEAEHAALIAAGELPPGAVSRPTRLTEILPVEVFDRARVHELLADVAVAQARLHALQAAAIVRLTQLQPVQRVLPGAREGRADSEDRPDDWVAEEVACVLGIGVSSASWLVDKQRVLHQQLPAVWTALADGVIDVRRGQVLVDALAHRRRSAGGGVADAVVDEVTAQGLAWIAEGVGPTRLADRVTGAMIAADPEEAQRRADKRQRKQNVTLVGAGDGLAGLRADLLSVEDAAAMQARVDSMAAVWRKDGDDRPVGMLRVESLKQLVLRPWEALPDGVPAGGQLRVRVDLADLDNTGPLTTGPLTTGTHDHSRSGQAPTSQTTTGTDTEGGVEGESEGEGEGEGEGRVEGGVGSIGGMPVPPVAVTELLARCQALQLSAPPGGDVWFEIIDATGRLRAVVDPGQVRRAASDGTSIGPPSARDGYTPSAGQVRFVRARDRHCRFPGCTRPAEYADLDHVVAYDHDQPAHGGATCVTNLICLCRRHHRLKTHAEGWIFRMDPDGTLHVTLPTGTTCTTRPPAMAETAVTTSLLGRPPGSTDSTDSTDRRRPRTDGDPRRVAAGGQIDPFVDVFGPTPKRYRTPAPDEQAGRRATALERARLATTIHAELDAAEARLIAKQAAERAMESDDADDAPPF